MHPIIQAMEAWCLVYQDGRLETCTISTAQNIDQTTAQS